MCRLAAIPDPAAFSPGQVHDLFDDLTAAYGGDGIGIAGYREGQPKLLKGVNMDEAYLAYHAVHGGPWDKGLIYHTRLATNGDTCDFFCHPFQTPRGFLAHNGVWTDYDRWWPRFKGSLRKRVLRHCNGPKGVSDSYVMALVYKHLTSRGVVEAVDGGVVLMQNKGKWPIVYVPRHGDFQIAKTPEGWVGASAIPYQWGKRWGVTAVLDVCPGSIVVLKKSGPLALVGHMAAGKLTSSYARYGPNRYSLGWGDDDYSYGVSGPLPADKPGKEQERGRIIVPGNGTNAPRGAGAIRDAVARVCHHVASKTSKRDLWSEAEYQRSNGGGNDSPCNSGFHPDYKF